MTIARNRLNYNTYGCPPGYKRLTIPRWYNRNFAGAPAIARMKVLSGTVADFDGLTIQGFILSSTGNTAFTLTFDDDAAPPSTSTVIKIQGLATAASIAEQIRLAMSLLGFQVSRDVDELSIAQPTPGSQGSTEIVVSSLLSDVISVNGIADFVGHTVFFYNGMTIEVPLRWGLSRGFGPGLVSHLQSEEIPV